MRTQTSTMHSDHDREREDTDTRLDVDELIRSWKVTEHENLIEARMAGLRIGYELRRRNVETQAIRRARRVGFWVGVAITVATITAGAVIAFVHSMREYEPYFEDTRQHSHVDTFPEVWDV